MAQYNGKQHFTIPRPICLKDGVNIETITADKDLSYFDSHYQLIKNSKGSSATIKVPVEKNGAWFWFHCDSTSAHAFVLQTSGGSPIIGGAGLAAGKSALLVCDGSQWAVAFEQA
jgi:hypothetical protein